MNEQPSAHVATSKWVEITRANPAHSGWYIERFHTLRRTVFTRPDSYFQRYAELSDDEATETALQIWKDINERNLVANIEPTRDRADVILRKASDHHVDEVRLRRI